MTSPKIDDEAIRRSRFKTENIIESEVTTNNRLFPEERPNQHGIIQQSQPFTINYNVSTRTSPATPAAFME